MKKLRLNSKVRRAFRGSSRGFSLIEVAIAIALIGVVAVAVMGALSYASQVLIITDRRATAESLAKSQMEYIKNQEYYPAEGGGVGNYSKISKITEIPYGYTIGSYNRDDVLVDEVVGIPWVSSNNTPAETDNGLQKVKLVVSYEIVRPENKVVEEKFILEGYKRQPGGYIEV